MEIISNQPKDNIRKNEIEMVQKEQLERTFIGTFLRTRGLQLFAYNYKADTLSMLKPEGKTIAVTDIDERGSLAVKQTGSKQECLLDVNACIPFEALNIKTAQKRLDKYKSGKISRLGNLVYVRR